MADKITDFKVVNTKAEVEPKELAKQLGEQIKKMEADKVKKTKAAKEHLIEMLDITAEKWLTANGVMTVFAKIKQVYENADEIIYEAGDYAVKASNFCVDISTRVKTADNLNELSTILDSEYNKEFATSDYSKADLIEELIKLDLCQQIGPSIEDIIEFDKSADEEIAKTMLELEELCKKNKLKIKDYQ